MRDIIMEETRVTEILPIVGRSSVNFTGISSRFYDHLENQGELRRLRSINHLGLLSEVYPTLNHSRYDYVLFQSVISDMLSKLYPGTTSSQGTIKIRGESYLGNEVIKLWILLSNFGHCKFTIGDEKTLLLYSLKRPGFLSILLKRFKSEKLIAWAKRVVDNLDYVNFHHIISIYRVYQSLPKQVDLQDELVGIYEVLLLRRVAVKDVVNQEKIQQLKSIYKNIRKLSIITLDSSNSHLPISVNVLSLLNSYDFNQDKFQDRKLSDVLDPLVNLLYDNLYLDVKAQTMQRAYELGALLELDQGNDTYLEIMKKAITTGLSLPKNNLHHFFRLNYSIKENQKIRDHFVISNGISEYSSSFESSVDFNLNTRGAVVDFYISKPFENEVVPSLLAGVNDVVNKIFRKNYSKLNSYKKQVAADVASKIRESSIDDLVIPQIEKFVKSSVGFQNSGNIRGVFARMNRYLLWTMIRFHIRDKYYFEVDTKHDIDNEIGVMLPFGFDSLTPLIHERISKTDNEDRKHELRHLLKSSRVKFNGIRIGCVARIKIYDYSKAPSKREVTDIDSTLMRFNIDSYKIEFHESKNCKNAVREARKDIKNKFLKVLGQNSKSRKISENKMFGARVVVQIDSNGA